MNTEKPLSSKAPLVANADILTKNHPYSLILNKITENKGIRVNVVWVKFPCY